MSSVGTLFSPLCVLALATEHYNDLTLHGASAEETRHVPAGRKQVLHGSYGPSIKRWHVKRRCLLLDRSKQGGRVRLFGEGKKKK
ncbi:hypothetical protein GGI42DRAFT_324677 [Trichoderma sp. SZMC 28013]